MAGEFSSPLCISSRSLHTCCLPGAMELHPVWARFEPQALLRARGKRRPGFHLWLSCTHYLCGLGPVTIPFRGESMA